MNLFDDDDFLSTTPKENFFDILFSANKEVVKGALDKLIERLAVAEKLIEEKNLDEEYEIALKNYPITKNEEIEDFKNSIYIETTANIVSQCE